MPDPTEIFQRFGENLARQIRVAMPGEIVSYDRAKRKASVQPHLREVYDDDRADDMPVIPGVPVMLWGDEDAFIDLPVKKGARCLLIFADRNLDTWVASGGKATPSEMLSHSLTDAIAIVGLRSFNLPPLADNLGNDVVISYAGATWRLTEDGKVKIKAPVEIEGTLKVSDNIDCEKTVTGSTDVIGGGKSLKTHPHSGVQPGEGNSGPPV